MCTPSVRSRMDLTWFVERGRWIAQGECQNIVGKSAQFCIVRIMRAAPGF